MFKELADVAEAIREIAPEAAELARRYVAAKEREANALVFLSDNFGRYLTLTQGDKSNGS